MIADLQAQTCYGLHLKKNCDPKIVQEVKDSFDWITCQGQKKDGEVQLTKMKTLKGKITQAKNQTPEDGLVLVYLVYMKTQLKGPCPGGQRLK